MYWQSQCKNVGGEFFFTVPFQSVQPRDHSHIYINMYKSSNTQDFMQWVCGLFFFLLISKATSLACIIHPISTLLFVSDLRAKKFMWQVFCLYWCISYLQEKAQTVYDFPGITEWLDRISLRGRVITRLSQSDWTGCNWEGGYYQVITEWLDRMSLRVRFITRLLQSDWTGCHWGGGLLPGYYRVTGQDVIESEGYYQVITEWLDRMSLRGRVITRLLQSGWTGCPLEGDY